MDDPSMDEFAQTRGADDLFDDEIIPVTAEEQEVQTEVIVVPEPEPEPEPAKPVAQVEDSPIAEKQAAPRGEASQRARGTDRGRGRGRGKGKTGGRGGGSNGLSESRWAEPKRAEGTAQSKSSTPAAESEAPSEEAAATSDKVEEAVKSQPAQDDEEKGDASGTNGAETARVPAVRGDRSATGGVRKVSTWTINA